MRFGSTGCLLLSVLVAGAPAPDRASAAQGKETAVYAVSGAYGYRTYCASCHGTDGKGEGPLAQNLRFHPPDLTELARRNGGEYPADKVNRIVDGRSPLKGHGGPEMPIWGDAFKNADTGYDDQTVRDKIRSIVDYVRTLQAK
jgi:mono/diheme cytochrome c family protein